MNEAINPSGHLHLAMGQEWRVPRTGILVVADFNSDRVIWVWKGQRGTVDELRAHFDDRIRSSGGWLLTSVRR